MNRTAVTNAGYRYAGESIEIPQSITEAQFRTIEQILGEPPARFKDWAEKFYFEPTNPRRATTLRKYLRDQNIAHSLERTETGTPQNQGDDTQNTCGMFAAGGEPPSVAELVALAAHLLLSSEDLDDAVHDAADEHAATLNSEGLDVQIDYLVARLGASDTQAAVEVAGRGDRTPPVSGPGGAVRP
jgi:hypothetical protein